MLIKQCNKVVYCDPGQSGRADTRHHCDHTPWPLSVWLLFTKCFH